ncbi:hypothetical protein O6H91_12G021200 [Diphasiastrum complanatum]|uniref:Uncharacterized protein n=1 Tax=Diphasiastrum complanatum TaxID=34168 RepID=A0ACC2C0K2_DIPCM|nr:hypothetical protein O6H91_12G021200 [Diphasiastrum complanatum]
MLGCRVVRFIVLSAVFVRLYLVVKFRGHFALRASHADSSFVFSEDALSSGETSKDGPPGEGPILRWETRLVLGPGGDGWHPANRKVKVSVYVKELELSKKAKERLLALVGKRYNPRKDELTIVSERYSHREENRKDVLRTLYALIEEANKADEIATPV